MQFGRYEIQNVLAACFLPPPGEGEACPVVTGVASGELFVWRGGSVVQAVRAHKPGPLAIQPDGSKAHGGVRGLKLRGDLRVLLSGGADGTLRQWDVADGGLREGREAAEPLRLRTPYQDLATPPGIRAIDSLPGSDRFAVGTNRCDVWEVAPDAQEVLVNGHTADLHGVAWHPVKPNVFASTCESSRIFVWDARDRAMLRTCSVGFAAKKCAFSAGPLGGVGGAGGSHHLAIGGKQGRLIVLDEQTLRPIFEAKDCGQAIADLKYSPDNRYLAVASHDTHIDIYRAGRDYAHVSRCTGHSATVNHIDWRADSKLLQANCAAYEVLYWDPRTGKQITANQRNAEWHTWTCSLGFPVMGIWPEDSDGTDVNAVDRSRSGRLLVTADDFGRVALFNYPCVVEDAPRRAKRGHSAHVACVRWNAEDRYVLSAGSRDRAMFLWEKVDLAPEPEAPAPPETVWGPLDPQAKTFGWLPEDRLPPGTEPAGYKRGSARAKGPASLPDRAEPPLKVEEVEEVEEVAEVAEEEETAAQLVDAPRAPRPITPLAPPAPPPLRETPEKPRRPPGVSPSLARPPSKPPLPAAAPAAAASPAASVDTPTRLAREVHQGWAAEAEAGGDSEGELDGEGLEPLPPDLLLEYPDDSDDDADDGVDPYAGWAV